MPLFTHESKIVDITSKAGRTAYVQFTKTIRLTQVMRQQGDDPAPFREVLDALRNNASTRNHWALLATRVQSALPLDEVQHPDSVPRLYSTNAAVREYNTNHLERLDSPVVNVQAENKGTGAASVESKDAGNFHNKLPLCRGGRVMLIESLWVKAGMVNGATGYIYDIA